MTTQTAKIIWTKIDEAPALATYSLLPIVNAFTKAAGVVVGVHEILRKVDGEFAKTNLGDEHESNGSFSQGSELGDSSRGIWAKIFLFILFILIMMNPTLRTIFLAMLFFGGGGGSSGRGGRWSGGGGGFSGGGASGDW